MSQPTLHRRLTSDTAQVGPTRRAIEDFAAEQGFDDVAAGEIGLVVNEALANIIRHAYAGASGEPVELQAAMVGPLLEIRLRDWGNGKIPDLTREKCEQDLLIPGGLGLLCLKKMMDEIEFVPQPDGMMLKMRRQKR
jgi:serine/threonine-protein kinase RsbW